MRQSLITIVILFFSLSVKAQKHDTLSKNQIKLAVNRLFDIINPGLEFSYERSHGTRFSTQLSLTYTTNILGKPYTALKGYRIAFEEKWFLSPQQKTRKYLSAEVVWNNMLFEEKAGYYDTVMLVHVENPFQVKKRTAASNFKFGTQYFYKKHFLFDLAIGLGFKYRNVGHLDRTYEFKSPREFDAFHASKNEAKEFTLNVPFVVRLGYRF